MFERKSKDTLPLGALKGEEDSRDYIAGHILGDIDPKFVMPEEVRLDIEEGNQGALEETRVACTCFAAYHVAQAINELEHQQELSVDFVKGWRLQKHLGTASEKGDYVVTALKSLVKNGLITEEGTYPIKAFARISLGKSTPEEIKYWLAKGYPIVTSARTTSTNFKRAKTTGYWTGLDGTIRGGHAFALMGYTGSNKDIVASQSYGSNYGFYGDGTFRIEDKFVKNLDSCYLVYDMREVKNIFTDVTEDSWVAEALKWAKDKKVIKGYEDGSFRPDQPMTRAEVVQVMYNYHKKFKK